MIIYIKKYCYIVIPLITLVVLIPLYILKILNVPNDPNNVDILKDYLSTLVGISGTLIGFLFTAITIFFSLNKDSQYMKYFKKYNHHIIFGRLVTIGIVFLCLNIVFWLFNFDKHIIVLSFIVGLENSIMAAYYIYKLSMNSFK